MHAVQFSRIAATAYAAGLIDPIPTFAAPKRSGGPHAGALRASFTRASPWAGGRRGEVSIGFLSRRQAHASRGGRGSIPPDDARVKAVAGPPDALSGGSVLAPQPGEATFSRSEHPSVEGGGVHVEVGRLGSPLTLTPPPAMRRRRASLRDATPSRSARSAGRCTARGHGPRHLLRRASVPEDPVEVRLGTHPRARAVETVGDQSPEAALVLARVAGGGASSGESSRYYSPRRASGIRMTRPNCSSGGSATPMWLPRDLLIFRSPSMPARSGIVITTWGAWP